MKTGLFFGSFNPVHVGHLIIAAHMLQNGLDKVWFVVTPHNPHKVKKSLLATNHRLYMTKLAIEDNPKFAVSDIETKLDPPFYTVNTLAVLREKYPNMNFVLIMGEDNLAGLADWKNPDEIVKHNEIYVYKRAGSMGKANSPYLHHPKVKLLDTPLMDISSTHIRESLKAGKDVRYLVTEPVYIHLHEMKFYQQ